MIDVKSFVLKEVGVHMILALTPENYEAEVIQSTIPVLVECYVPWCTKCAMMQDLLSELSQRYVGRVKICQMDIDAYPDLATQYGIRMTPSFLVFKEGKPIMGTSGIMSECSLIRMMECALR
jgi:thioredoxin 1